MDKRQEKVKEFIQMYLQPTTTVSNENAEELYLENTGVTHKDLIVTLLRSNYITGMSAGTIIVNYGGFRFVIKGDK